MTQPKWLSEEWCDHNNQDDCLWYSKITSVSGGPDTQAIQWLDWDETNKKFIWTEQTKNQDTGHQFWIRPKTDKTYMRVARTKDSTHDASWYTNLSGSGGGCDGNQSNITSNCIIHHDRGPGNNSYYCSNQGCLCVGNSWDPSSWNDTTNAGKGGTGTTCCDSKDSEGRCLCNFNNTDNVNDTSWTINTGPNDGGLYNYVNQFSYHTQAQSHGPSACNTNYFPRYFAFGQQSGANVVSNPGKNENNWHKNNYRNGCGVDSTSSLDQAMCQSKGGMPSGNDSLNGYSWISENTAMNCCGYNTAEVKGYAQCGATDNPGGFNTCNPTGFCSTFMNLNCNDRWSECAVSGCTPNTDSCNDFLRNGNCAARNAVRDNITAYINDPVRKPTDYISWKLRNNVGSPSYNYYNNHGCKTEPDGTFYEDPQNKDPCTRDDSKDPFFINKLIYLCNAGSDANQPDCENLGANDMCYYPTDPKGNRVPGNPTGRCDDLLHYFCQQFTREDVEVDATLVSICGCSLLPPGHIPYQPPFVGVYWTPTEGIPPAKSAYDTNVPNTTQCDTPCMSSQILQTAGSCVANYCVIDGVTLNYINSDPGNTDITQQCGTCGQDGTCQCYMGDITVNEFNSKNKGGLSMSQYCGNCYQTDASGSYIPVNCQTGVPLNGDDQPDNGKKDDSKPWWKKKITIITAVILILTVVVFLGYWFSVYHETNSVPEQVQTFDDYYYY
jgi:hypothetical protein